MLRALKAVFILSIGVMSIIGCSGAGGDPIAASEDQVPETNMLESRTNHVLWGIWHIRLDANKSVLIVEPARNIQLHFNITDMVTPPVCHDCLEIHINTFDPVTRILDVDATLRNKCGISGYDIRGILYTNDIGHMLTNPDDWTKLYDLPVGLEYNPFKAFAKDAPQREFAAAAVHTENYLLYIPKPPQWEEITFAVDASWPGNCKEPYSIDDFTQLGELYEFTGMSVDIQVNVRDWQDDVTSVALSIPEITGEESTGLSYLGGNTWGTELVNAAGACAGEYAALVTAHSFNPGDVALYDFVTITVTETNYPSVTAIDPGSGEVSEHLSDVTITGENFLGPCVVELLLLSAPAITAENVVVDNQSAITCDISIPLNAPVGNYDVEVTNVDSKSGKAEELFEVICPEVEVSDVSPDSWERNSTCYCLTITGEGFAGPGSEVRLRKTGEPDIDAYDIFIESSVLMYCAVFIPADAALGLYDVEVTNGCGNAGTGIGLFEIIEENPENGWARTWGEDGNIPGEYYDVRADGVAVDNTGGVYVTGLYEGTVDFDPGLGIEEHTSNGGGDVFLCKYNSSGDFQWARTWGGQHRETEPYVDVDNSGNILVTGSFSTTVDFDPGPGVDEYTPIGMDAFVSKFDSQGDFIWARTWGGLKTDCYCLVFDIAIGDSGSIYIAGDYSNWTDFDPGPAEDIHYSNGGYDSYLAKFDSSGDFLWARTWGASCGDVSFGVGVDNSGNPYVTGAFFETVDFDPGPEVDYHSSNGGPDIFLSKFNSNGDFQWARTWGSSLTGAFVFENGFAVDVDDSGNVCVVGVFYETLDFDPGPGVDEHTSNGLGDSFVSKFDSTGDFLWAGTWGGPLFGWARDIAIDNQGEIVVAGDFQGTADFDPGAGTYELTTNGHWDAYLMKLSDNGELLWARNWGDWVADRATGTCTDDLDNIYFAGWFNELVDFDPGIGIDPHNAYMGEDAFLCKLMADGFW